MKTKTKVKAGASTDTYVGTIARPRPTIRLEVQE